VSKDSSTSLLYKNLEIWANYNFHCSDCKH